MSALRRARPGVIAFVLLAALQAAWFLPRSQVALDFGQFWSNAKLPLAAHATADEFVGSARRVLAEHRIAPFSVYMRPPVFSLLTRPLALFSFPTAFRVWVVVQFALLCAFLLLLRGRTKIPWPFVAAVGVFEPAMFGIVMGHDVAFLPLLCFGGFLCLERKRHNWAGLLFGLCVYKFALMLLLPVFLAVKKEFRALAAFGITAAVLAALSAAVMPPGEYLKLITHVDSYMPGYGPWLMVGLRQLAWAAGHPESYWVAAAALAGAACLAMWRLDTARAYCLAVAAGLFCAPHVNFYDYTLLLAPAFLLAQSSRPFMLWTAVLMAAPILWIDRGVAGMLVFLFCALLAGSAFGSGAGDECDRARKGPAALAAGVLGRGGDRNPGCYGNLPRATVDAE